ncbi:MAG: hypothetical protein CHACPFDD_01600 [Phycisphaerae bacterium]|nr:hypothetical protein [Phycisphaerae bacterium]
MSEMPPRTPHPKLRGARAALNLAENGVAVFALAAMVILPLLEIVLRRAFHVGVAASSTFVQHGTLIVGLVGGAIAARENRLLSLAAAQFFPKGWPASVARVASASAAAAISTALCLGSALLVRDEYEVGKIIAYGVPVWFLQLALPVGFGLVALRIIWHAGTRWPPRGVALLAAAALLALAWWSPIAPARLVWPAFGLLLLATILGAPIFTVLGGAALILFWGEGSPIASIAVDHYRLVISPSLPTVPLFTLAGYVLAEGGASARLVRVFTALFGAIRGGPAIITVLVCAFFTSFTGASGVTILALGGLLLPVLTGAGFSDRAALGLLTGAGSLGMLFPPCLPLILYAIIAQHPIEDVFLAAALPGVVLLLLTTLLGIWLGPRGTSHRPPFRVREACAAVWAAKWELVLPVVCLVSLFGGFATPVEAAAVTALYAVLSQTLLNRDLSPHRDLPRVFVECGLVIGGVLLILGVAQGFTNYLIYAQVPDQMVAWVVGSVRSPLVFLLMLNLFLLVVGCLMDIYSAIVVVVPLIIPIGVAFNIDPLHLGIIFLANLELGYLTPPVGMNLFLSSYRFGRSIPEVTRAAFPILVVQFIGVLLITYWPALTTTLPKWLQSST